MSIDVGQDAPDFTLKNQDETEWTLSDQLGKKVVLFWYPLDWSPTCEQENCKISNEPLLTADDDTVLVGISRDSTWSHKAWRAAKSITHDLLADPTLEVTKLYGLQHPAVGFLSQRATVVVDREGKIALCEVQENTTEERELAPIQDALSKLD